MGKTIIMEKRTKAEIRKDIADVSKLLERLNKKNINWVLSVFFDSADNIIYGDLHNKREELWDWESDYQLLIEPMQIPNNDSQDYTEAIYSLYHSQNKNTTQII